ncbi:DUF2207 domain-containing protein [Cytobacillus sp. Hz8]|uniref:DUF2207 domain-containing protein n=1 Tax=Cytobacillus sp. Hz8 TaxID=3347168 RepID=UPI0035D8F65A
MNRKLRLIFPLMMSMIAALFLFPEAGMAVDYSITNMKIDAFLQENGQVKVTEKQTYSFDGEFNGITREIVPKAGASISNFKAIEHGKVLKVKKEKNLYKVYRKGEDDTITVTISYTIKNGVDVYSDVAEFYWPFFDERNESTYENMNITVHPPSETQDVIAFGYDEAFDTEKVLTDGSVLFQLGEVPSEENGDIRVAYDTSLFPKATVTSHQERKSDILGAEQKLKDEAAAWTKKKDIYSTIALFLVPIFSLILILIIIWVIMRSHLKKMDVERKLDPFFYLPKENLSMPATIYFTKRQLSSEAMAAALLDLVRKGYVVKKDENRFVLGNIPSGIRKHEEIFIHFLFDEIGSNGEFQFADLKTYIQRKANHEKYQKAFSKWKTEVINEVNEQNFYERNGKFRLLLGLISVLLIPFVFIFASYDLYGWLIALIILILGFFAMAIFYVPKNSSGLMVIREWNSMKERMQSLTTKDWEALINDDQMRAYIYGIGINDKKMIRKNEELIRSFAPPPSSSNYGDGESDYNLYSLLFIGQAASSNFYYAQQKTAESTSSSSSSSGGGGVGGGGGGSGAF